MNTIRAMFRGDGSASMRLMFWLGALFLLVIFIVLRVGLINRQGLWADELFSLALATGHSLEHAAAQADPALGDYVEAAQPLPPSAYSRYLEHENPIVGPGRVIRAVFLSDTSPPLYYLLLYVWTGATGTSDAALRLFSISWSLGCFPMMWSLARQVGGKAARLFTCTLFTFSPLCVYYSTEGRMYSLLWFCAMSQMWLTLHLWRRGFRLWSFILWVAVGVAGFLTHYFFAFVWAAAISWLWLQPRRFPRRVQALGIVLIGLLVLPWYVRLPELLTNWRVTGHWLDSAPGGFNRVLAFCHLPWSFLSIHGVWGVRALFDGVNLALFLVLAALVWKKLYRSLWSPPQQLLWFWMLGACLGPVAFDLLRGTYVMAVPRYALAGMPAAFLLVGVGLSCLGKLPRAAFLVTIVLVCSIGIGRMYGNDSRHYEPMRQVGELLAKDAEATDLVIVHSIPSGVAGIARYMDGQGTSAKGIGFASWVGQLKQHRVPEDVQCLALGRQRIILVKIHEVGEPAPQEHWLRENTNLVSEKHLESALLLYFIPHQSEKLANARVARSINR